MARTIQAHVNQKKKDTVQRIVENLKKYPIVGILNMEALPAGALAGMRKKLRPGVEIIMAKKRIMRIAFKEAGLTGAEKLEQHMKGMPALLFTTENPFTLFKTLKKNQSPAPIKAGQETPEDIVIPAGATNFPPGPIIGELGQMGIKAGIENGKVVIKQDKVLLKEGDVVDDPQAGFLQKMDIKPMKIGLSLTAALENGDVLTKNVLDIDEDQYLADLRHAAGFANTLAMEIVWPTTDNISTLIAKAHYQAAGLALELDLLTDNNARDLLAKAYWQAVGVAKYLPEDMREALPETPAAPAQEATTEATPQEEEKKKDDDKDSEADTAAGLGAMFG